MIANSLSMHGCLYREEGGVDAQVLEERLHADEEGLVVAVDGGPVGGPASSALGLRMPARMGAMTWSRRASRAAMVRAARLGTW
jgi:hypothetical protein